MVMFIIIGVDLEVYPDKDPSAWLAWHTRGR